MDFQNSTAVDTHCSQFLARVRAADAQLTMSELLATVSGAEVKVWRPDAQVRKSVRSRSRRK